MSIDLTRHTTTTRAKPSLLETLNQLEKDSLLLITITLVSTELNFFPMPCLVQLKISTERNKLLNFPGSWRKISVRSTPMINLLRVEVKATSKLLFGEIL